MYTKVSIYDNDVGNSPKTERYVTFISDTDELYAIVSKRVMKKGKIMGVMHIDV